jgi:hypothetical protein
MTWVYPAGADPMSRAHAREAAGLHKLRKGRDRCIARRRDGGRCLAPAVKGAVVCRRHGGAAPQVAIAAKHVVLMEALYTAAAEWEEAKGTPGEFDALCRWSGRRTRAHRVQVQASAPRRPARRGQADQGSGHVNAPGLRHGRDGKSYPARPLSREQRNAARWLAHRLVHCDGLSIRRLRVPRLRGREHVNTYRTHESAPAACTHESRA